MRGLPLAVLGLASACATGGGLERPSSHARPRDEQAADPPTLTPQATAWPAPTLRPPPPRDAADDHPAVLVVESPLRQARAVALRFAAALVEGDAAEVEALLDARVRRVRTGRLLARGGAVEHCSRAVAKLRLRPGTRMEALVAVDDASTEPLDGQHPDAPAIEVRLPAAAERGLPCARLVHIRTGPDPRVIAIGD